MRLIEGKIYSMQLYSQEYVRCRVLRIHAFGTIDVERLSDGRCFRITGLRFE